MSERSPGAQREPEGPGAGFGVWEPESLRAGVLVHVDVPRSCRAPAPSPHLELLLLGQQVVVLVALVEGDQHVLQPVPHAQGELGQLRVQAGGDDCKPDTALSTSILPPRLNLSPWARGAALPEGNGPTYICRAQCSPGAACAPSWFPPGCTWWRRNGRRSRRSCCRCRRPAWDGEVLCEGHVSPGSAPKRGV